MGSKVFHLDDIGDITVYKRKGARKISLRVAGPKIRVTQPHWLPYQSGVMFARHQADWIQQQNQQQLRSLIDGQQIGKQHQLQICEGSKLASRVQNDRIRIVIPPGVSSDEQRVQLEIRKAIKRALTIEAKTALPKMLDDLAYEHGFRYTTVRVKSMRSRWGSCTHDGTISLNCFLMQLPWEQIEYVLLHELVHTKHMNHGASFWHTMRELMPDVDVRRKALKAAHSAVFAMQ